MIEYVLLLVGAVITGTATLALASVRIPNPKGVREWTLYLAILIGLLMGPALILASAMYCVVIEPLARL